MKRIFSNIIFLVVVVLACLLIYRGVLGHFAVQNEEIDYKEYEKLYYYKQLTDEQKELYIKLDKGINNLDSKITLGFMDINDLKSNVDRTLSAVYNDRPEYYFLPSEYNVKTINFLNESYTYVEFEYDVKNQKERDRKDKELKNAIQQLLYECITPDMTDMEKEIAIHDELVKSVKYYEYENIDDVPHEMHTSYAALVKKEAVCDGISKAMMLLLDEVGVETIVVFGAIDETPHAWNIVNVEGEYYHLDATSDTIKMDSDKYVTHNYFNLTDKELFETHILYKDFNMPKCTENNYNYYKYNGYYVLYEESMRTKMAKIINKQINSDVLEVKIDQLYSTQNILEALYFLDFNDWHTNGKTSVNYHNINNVYIFKNEIRRSVNY